MPTGSKNLAPTVAPTATPKNNKIIVLVEPPTKTIDKPYIGPTIERPEGTEVRIEMTPLEFIQYGVVNHQISADGTSGVQRAHSVNRSAEYAQAILKTFEAGAPSLGLRHDPVVNFEGIVTSGPALRFSPDTKVQIDDGQHLFFALQRVYSEGESANDPAFKLRIRSFLEDTVMLVRVTLDWNLQDRRRLFYDINGLAKPVSGSQAAFYAVTTNTAAGPLQMAGEAVEVLRTDPDSPLKDKIGITGATPKGGFAFQVLQKLLAKHMLYAKTAEEMAIQFANYWTAIEGTFPEQKELTNSGFRQAFLQAYTELSKTGNLDVLANAINGSLSVLMPVGATGSGSIQAGVYKAIMNILRDVNNGHHAAEDNDSF